MRETGHVGVVYCSDLVEMVELWCKLSPETVFSKTSEDGGELKCQNWEALKRRDRVRQHQQAEWEGVQCIERS